jgi:hypothetical protein
MTAPEHEVEITPEMIAAGADALAGFNRDFESAEERVVEIYEAMFLARPGYADEGPPEA